MGLSSKMLIGGAAGVAALALVGVGASASFTDSAVGQTSGATGDVGVHLYAQYASYTTEGVANTWDISQIKDAVPGSAESPNSGTGYDGGNNGFELGALKNLGSDFTGTVHFQIANSGSLPISHLALDVTDPAGSAHLAKDTVVKIMAVNDSTPLYDGSLYNLVHAGSIDVTNVFGTFSVGQSHWLDATLSAPAGGYTDRDADQSMTPTFTVTASDA